jgi:hypothetical protein
MTKAAIATPNHPLYCLDDLIEKRRNLLRYACTFPPGAECNQHRQIAVSLRVLFRNKNWLATNINVVNALGREIHREFVHRR